MAIWAGVKAFGDGDNQLRVSQIMAQPIQHRAHAVRSDRYDDDLRVLKRDCCFFGRESLDLSRDRDAETRMGVPSAKRLDDRAVALGPPEAHLMAIVCQWSDEGGAHVPRAHDGDSCHGCSLIGARPARGFTGRG